MARPKFAPKSTPCRGPIPKPNYLPHTWTRSTYDDKRHPDPIRHFSTMHWTDRRADRRTDRQIVHVESLITIGRCAPRVTRPNNTSVFASVCYRQHFHKQRHVWWFRLVMDLSDDWKSSRWPEIVFDERNLEFGSGVVDTIDFQLERLDMRWESVTGDQLYRLAHADNKQHSPSPLHFTLFHKKTSSTICGPHDRMLLPPTMRGCNRLRPSLCLSVRLSDSVCLSVRPSITCVLCHKTK